MSERTRRGAGIVLIVTSILLCILPLLHGQHLRGNRFESIAPKGQYAATVPTERNGPVAVNDADGEELTVLPGIGETLSGLIIDERKRNGPFYYAEDLIGVKGIGPSTLKRIRDQIDLSQTESEE